MIIIFVKAFKEWQFFQMLNSWWNTRKYLKNALIIHKKQKKLMSYECLYIW